LLLESSPSTQSYRSLKSEIQFQLVLSLSSHVRYQLPSRRAQNALAVI